MLEIIKQFVRRMLMGKGAGIPKIPTQKAVDDFAKDLLKKFKQNGVPDEAVTNPKDVKIIWEQITNREAQILSTSLKDVLKKSDPFKKAGDVVDLTGKKIDTSKPILGGKNVPETEAHIKAKIDAMNKKNIKKMKDIAKERKEFSSDIVTETIATIKSKKPIDGMKEANSVIGRKGKYKNLTEEQSQKILKETDDHIMGRDRDPDMDVDPEDFAGGGIAGMLGETDRVPYKDAKLVEGESYIPPKNFYALGIGPGLDEFMREGVPRDEEGFHTTLSKEDLEYLWDVLQGEHPIEDIEDKLMFRFGRVNPEKDYSFHL